MRFLSWLTRDLDLYQLGFLIWGIAAVVIVGLIFSIGIAVGRWFGA
ncbi:MAG TPA: hypothetical protein PKV98_04150 [Burkholderiaceae bacterium]|nr:hypothetical protein [Burkholderiaceae bacterium]